MRAAEKRVDLRRVLAAGFGEIRPASAAAADDGREFLDELTGFDAIGQVFRHRHEQLHLAVVLAGEDDDAAPEPIAERVGESTQRALFETADAARDEFRVADRDRVVVVSAHAAAERELHFQLFVFAAEPLQVRLQARDGLRRVFGRRAEGRERARKRRLIRLNVRDRARAGERFDSAHAGGHTRFLGDHEGSDVTGRANVRAAAQFDAEAGDRHDAHGLPVFFAEERHRAALDRVFGALHVGRHRRIAIDLIVDDALDLAALVLGERLRVREVEPQPIGRDERARLPHVRAELLPQRRVEQVRRGVIATRGVAGLGVDLGRHVIADLQRAPRLTFDAMNTGLTVARPREDVGVEPCRVSLPTSDTCPPASR